MRRNIVFDLIHGDQMRSPSATQLIEDEIPRDRHEPRCEFGGRFVTRSGFPNTNKHLLPDILGLCRAAKHSSCRPDDTVLMSFHELFEGLDVAALSTKHKRNILLILIVVLNPTSRLTLAFLP